MTTDLVPVAASDLALSHDQTYWTDPQLGVLRQLGLENATRPDLMVFHHVCKRTGLDPFAKQIHMIERQGKWTIQTGIDGFRLVARRAVDVTGETLGYLDALWCGADGKWTDVWLSDEPPAAAKATVLRNGQPYPAIALYREYVGLKRDGKPNSMWTGKPALMLAKCAEALALRKAFPQDLSGLYTSDEMQASSHPTVEVNMAEVLAYVAAAQTEDEVRAVWREYAARLTDAQRATLTESSKIRIDQLHDDTPPHDPETGEIADDGIEDAVLVDDEPQEQAPTATGGTRGPLGRDIATRPATAKQIGFLEDLAKKAGHLDLTAYLDSKACESVLGGAPSDPLTDGHARLLIDALKAEAA